MIKNFFSFIFELIKIVVISLAIILPVRHYLIQPFYVKGASMEPNFYDHEYLIVNEISYRFREPIRGEIVVFRYPQDPREFYIKRIIGLPGEKVQIKNGAVIVYNEDYPSGYPLEEEYLDNDIRTYGTSEDIINIDEESFFVLGDNRNSSRDSRNFGPIKRSFIIGKVLIRGWPFNRINTFPAPEYQFN